MPDASGSAPLIHRRVVRRLIALLAIALVLVGCAAAEPPALGAGDRNGLGSGSSQEPPYATSLPGQAFQPLGSGDVGAELCRRVGEVEARLTSMRGVELRVPNRVALDIELGQLQVAVGELEEADLGAFEDELETPRTRLGYRLREVELAVEDFRTNTRPQRAVPHVEKDTQTFADELAAFTILARC